MNPHLAKEFRPLLLPWSIAAVAAAGYLVGGVFLKGEFASFLSGLAGAGFFVGCLVLTAMPLGFELHAHTLGLLLSQPIDRARLWKSKLFVAAVAVLALGTIHGLATALTGRLHWQEALACLAFMAAAVCSVGYWTLAAGSVLIGIASAVSIPLWIAFAVHMAVSYVLGIELQFNDQTALVLGAVLCIGYCAFFLWLGRRQVVGLELKAAVGGRIAQIPPALVPRRLAELFRCRPTGAMANLIRKETCLQRPIFLVSAVFTVGWLLILILMLVRPAWQDNCVAVLNGLTVTQVALIAILTGCISLGDDKSLGTIALHLTQPVSVWRQWLIKFQVAMVTGVAMAVALPLLLASITLFKAKVGLLALNPFDALEFAVVALLVFTVSFWATSLVANTVRGVLTAMLALMLIAFSVGIGSTLGEQGGGLQSELVCRLWAEMQMLPAPFPTAAPFTFLLGLCVLATALTQSFRQFRRMYTRPRTAIRDLAIVIGLIFAIAIWRADFELSSRRWGSSLIQSVDSALRSLSLEQFPLDRGVAVTPLELEKTKKLSFLSKRWLRNSTIEVTRYKADSGRTSRIRRESYRAVINLPSGRSFPLGGTLKEEPIHQTDGEKE